MEQLRKFLSDWRGRLHGWRQSRVWLFAVFLLRRFNELNVPQVSASLTFTTLLALVPLITVALVVVSAFPVFADVSEQFNRLITQTLMPSGAEAVSRYIFEFRNQASRLTAIGIVMMGVTSLMLIQTIEGIFNRIWRVGRPRALFMRFLVYWALLSLGPLVLGMGMSVWGVVWAKTAFYVNYPLAAQSIQFAASLTAATAVLCLLYKLVPARFVPLRHALVGAAVAAVGLELLRRGFAVYVGSFNSYQLVYGTFAAIPIFLIWLNLMWMLILSGAVFTASLSYWKGDAFKRYWDDGSRFGDVLQILMLLAAAHQDGCGLKIQQLRRHIRLGYDGLGGLLEQLAEAGYAAQSRDGGWLLKQHPDHIRVRDLFARFVYREQERDGVAQETAVRRLMRPALTAADVSLGELLAEEGGADMARRP